MRALHSSEADSISRQARPLEETRFFASKFDYKVVDFLADRVEGRVRGVPCKCMIQRIKDGNTWGKLVSFSCFFQNL